MKKVRSGGGWPAVRYAIQTARRAGGIVRFLRALRSPNACKTCAFGMGGVKGGMVDEAGHFPEICKKSMQAMAADMQGGISPRFFEQNSFQQLEKLTPKDLEHLGRLVHPLYAGREDTHYRVISWNEAIERFSTCLKVAPPDESFFYASGRASNEAGFLLQLFARLYGTNNVNNCSYYCHQASGVGLSESIGTGTATVVLDDLTRCDLVFLIGGNPASNHPRLMRQLMKIRRRGGQVIVINPVKETGLVNFSVPSDLRSLVLGSPIASQYVQPLIGGDIALLSGIAKRLFETNAIDQSFVDAYTEGFANYADSVRTMDWDDIVESSGVDFATIDRIAATYSQSERAVFAWTMGITHHRHGVDNVRAIANLALLRGMVGKPGAGLMPIRGHSNVQGVGSVGVTPALKRAVLDRLESHFGVALPKAQGLDTLACLDAMKNGDMRVGLCLGGNFFGASPDSEGCRKAFDRLDAVCYLSTTMNTGHVLGRAKDTLILPVLARDEESQPTTQESMFNYVRLSEGGPQRHVGPRSEVDIIGQLAQHVLGDDGPIDWAALKSHRRLREAIAAIVPGFEEIAAIDETRKEFQLRGRTFHRPFFATESGKANFGAVNIPSYELQPDELRLMTVRSEGQFNTVVYEEHDLYRHQERRDIILMNSADTERLGLVENQRVIVTSLCGSMERVLVRQFDIRAGCAAMYFPEANRLVSDAADPKSRTPAYKAVIVSVKPMIDGQLVQVRMSTRATVDL